MRAVLRTVLRLWRGLLLGLIGALLPAALWAQPAAPATVLTQAQFSSDGQVVAEQTVALPDTWAQRGLSNRGAGVYRLNFVLPPLSQWPQEGWALQIDRLAEQHEVRLNGTLLSSRLTQANLPHRSTPSSRATPNWLPLPSPLLQRGGNELLITVRHSTRGGLSPVVIGPASALWDASQLEQWRVMTLPVMLNSAGMALGLFMLIFWWRRRSEWLLGGFGLLWLAISLRSTVQILTPPSARGMLLDGFMYASQIFNAMLLGGLALGMADLRGHAWRQVLGVTGVVLMLAAIPAAALGAMDALRTWAYPLMFVVVLPPLVLVARNARALRSSTRLVLLAAVLTLVVAAGHDYLCWRGTFSVMAVYWIPLALPVVLSVFAWRLIQRVTGALREVEQLNTDLEGRVAERTQAVEQAHRAKTRFLAAASHDLRQPVVSIGLMIDLLRDQLHAPAQLRLIDRVDEAMASLEQLLKGLLDLSRLDAGTVQPRRSAVVLQPLFDAIEAHEQPTATRKNLRLRLRATPLAVHTDAVLLEQILRNLVGNALRYTPRGGVLIAARRHGTQVRLQVWDSGIGIAEDQQGLVFEEFVQSRQAGESSHAGLGLGLAIVRRATRLLGHELRLRSRVGQGSCFELILPRASTALRPSQTAEALSPPEPAWPLFGLRLAVVDDEATVREALAARLSAWGAQVQSFSGVTPLRQRLAMRPRGHSGIDLLVTDWRLNGSNGLQAIEALHSYAGPVPVLVITGNTAPDELARLDASGVPVLHKPFRAEALLAAVLQLQRASGRVPDSVIETQPGAGRRDDGLNA